MISKINNLYKILLVVTLILMMGSIFIDPVYANAEKDNKSPCGENCTYIGMRVDCYDSHCDQSSVYKHGAYFKYYCVDTCTGYSWYQEYFQYCRSIC
jgi:hypothetical protein